MGKGIVGFALGIQACQAALDIAKAVDDFNRSSDKLKLPTRIGLHSGNIILGSIGAMDHYEYHPIGDIVNTSERIQGLNKYLGTRILVSEEVIGQLRLYYPRTWKVPPCRENKTTFNS